MSYTSEEPAADSRTWTLTGPRDGTVQLHSRHHSFTDASYKAVAHANSVREELTRRTVTDYRHPQFDARLQVVTNGATRMTEVVLNGRDSTTRLVLDLSELLGEQAWRATGLGAPTDIDQLQQRIATLEQQVVESRLQLEEGDQDLAAARAANRELITQLTTSPPTG